MPAQPAALRRWYAVVESKDPALLDELLADEVAFRSPAVYAPQQGKTLTASYLSAALKVLGPRCVMSASGMTMPAPCWS